MEKEHFGNCLRRARESRDISLLEVAQKTKVSRSVLELLEKGDLDLLPAGVYSRGFIRSFARAVGADEEEPLLLYQRAVEARSAAEKARSSTPVSSEVVLVAQSPSPTGYPMNPQIPHPEDEASAPRRGLGLAVFVIILLLIATITLSLLLRRPPPSGEGLSVAPRDGVTETSRSPQPV
jgi:cytoskeleton protein RodZ